jgi:uncharacterized protein (TIGR02391 family)
MSGVLGMRGSLPDLTRPGWQLLARHTRRASTGPERAAPPATPVQDGVAELKRYPGNTADIPSDALILSRRGRVFKRAHIERLRLERLLPDLLLHERIRQVCVDIFNTGHHQAAVFEAFRILEVGIREAAGYGQNEHGETMINNAFNEKAGGPLVDTTAPESEQRAMRFLMVGSNGLFRNPRGHRDVEMDDPKEAAELLIVASHLLRMVETRAAARKAQGPVDC